MYQDDSLSRQEFIRRHIGIPFLPLGRTLSLAFTIGLLTHSLHAAESSRPALIVPKSSLESTAQPDIQPESFESYQIRILRNQNQLQSDKIKALREELENVTQKLHEIKPRLFTQSDPADQAKIAELSQKLSAKEALALQLQTSQQEMENEVAFARKKLNEMEMVKEALTAMIEKTRIAKEQNSEDFMRQIEQFHADASNEKNSLLRKIQRYESENQHLQNALSAKSQDVQRLDTVSSKLNAALAAKHEELLALDARLLGVYQEMLEATDLHKVKERDLHSEIHHLNANLEKHQTQNRELKAFRQEMQWIADLFSGTQAILNKEISNLSTKLQSEQENRQALAQMKSDLEAQYNKLGQRLQSNEAARQDALSNIQNLSIALATEHDRTQELEQELYVLLSQQEAGHTYSENLEHLIGDIDDKLKRQEQQSAQTNALHTHVAATLAEKLNQMQMALDAHKVIVNNLTDKLDEEKQNNRAMDGALNEKAVHMATLLSYLDQAETAIDVKRADHHALHQQFTSATERWSRSQETLQNALAESFDNYAKAMGKASQLEQDLHASNTKASGLEEELAHSNAKASGLEEELTHSNAKATGLEQELANSNTKASGLEEELAHSNAKASGLAEELANSNVKTTGLEEELAHTSATASGLEEELALRHYALLAQQGLALEMEARHAAATSSLEERLQKLGEELQNETNRSAQLEILLQNIAAQEQESSSSLQSHKELLAQRMAEIEDLRQMHSDAVSQLERQVGGLKDNLETQTGLTRHLALEVNRKHEELGQSLRDREQELIAKQGALEESQTHLEQTKTDLTSRLQEIGRALEEERSQANSLLAQVDQLTAEREANAQHKQELEAMVRDLSRDLSEKQQLLSLAESKASAKEDDQQTLANQNSDLAQQNLTVRKAHMEALDLVLAQETALAELQRQLSQAQRVMDNASTMDEQIAHYRASLEEKESKIASLERSQEEAEKTKSGMISQLEQLLQNEKNHKAALERDLQYARMNYTAERRSLLNLEQIARESLNKNHILENAFAEAQKNLDNSSAQMQKMAIDHADLEHDIVTLSQKLEEVLEKEKKSNHALAQELETTRSLYDETTHLGQRLDERTAAFEAERAANERLQAEVEELRQQHLDAQARLKDLEVRLAEAHQADKATAENISEDPKVNN